jgi:hypothetical protein
VPDSGSGKRRERGKSGTKRTAHQRNPGYSLTLKTPLSGASRSSHDRNRGEGHDDVEIGAQFTIEATLSMIGRNHRICFMLVWCRSRRKCGQCIESRFWRRWIVGGKRVYGNTLACAAFGLHWPNDLEQDRTYPDFEESPVADLRHHSL